MINNEMTLNEFLNTLYDAWEVSCEAASCPLKPTIEKVREEFQKMKPISTHTFERWLRHCYNNWTKTGVILYGCTTSIAKKYGIEFIQVNGRSYCFIECNWEVRRGD